MSADLLFDERMLASFIDVEGCDLSLAGGYPGLILFLAQFGMDAEIHRYVVKMKETIEADGISNSSLFSGASGICFALQQVEKGKRYQRMIHSLHGFIAGQLEPFYLRNIEENIQLGRASFAELYDPILGVCGIGRYAMQYWDRGVAKRIAEVLVKLSQPIKGSGMPGWHMCAEDRLNAKSKDIGGNFNLGLAHGVTGVLAYLSIAKLKGIEVEGQKEAISKIAEWIRGKGWKSERGMAWPYNVSWEEEVGGREAKRTSRDAWCYGAPGICRTLDLAGQALGDDKLRGFAKDAFKDVFLRKKEEWHLPGPTLCHGIAGLFLITQALGEDAGGVRAMLVDCYRPESIWGFKDAQPVADGIYREVDNIGFLEGAIGVWLTLLSKDRSWALPLMIDV